MEKTDQNNKDRPAGPIFPPAYSEINAAVCGLLALLFVSPTFVAFFWAFRSKVFGIRLRKRGFYDAEQTVEQSPSRRVGYAAV